MCVGSRETLMFANYNQLHIHESRSSGVFSNDGLLFTYCWSNEYRITICFYKAHNYFKECDVS